MGFPRRLLADDEQLVLAVRPHGKVLVGPVLVLFVVAPVVVVMVSFVPLNGPGRVLRVAMVLTGLLVVVRGTVVPFLAWLRTRYVLTSRRILVRRGIVRRTGRDIPLGSVVGVDLERRRWDQVLGSARMLVHLDDEPVPLILHDVPAVEHVEHAVLRHSGLVAEDDAFDDEDDEVDDEVDEVEDELDDEVQDETDDDAQDDEDDEEDDRQSRGPGARRWRR